MFDSLLEKSSPHRSAAMQSNASTRESSPTAESHRPKRPQVVEGPNARGPNWPRARSLSEAGLVGLIVGTLHVVLVAGLLWTFIGRPGTQPGPSRTMVLLMTLNQRLTPKQPTVLREIKVQLIPPHFEVMAVSPISVPIEVVGSLLNTSQPVSPPFERLISEAEAQNPQLVRDFCKREYAGNGELRQRGTVVLMIRVEADGHVSDTKVEESSGSSRLDEATQACLTEAGLFEPHHSAGKPAASWQRTHWTWSGGS
jgi:TonB family protein